MAIVKTSREEILKNAVKLFKIKGYYNTSMADIASSCGIIKGSLYHHFKSKDEVGIEGLKYIHDYFVREVYSVAYQEELALNEKLELYIQKIDAYFLHSEGGCIFGNFALELSSEKVAFKDVIREDFQSWTDSLATMFEEKYPKEEALALAKEYVALTQGAIMMMNLHNSSIEYLKVGQKIISLLKD
jgi:AcrR family transcriptional regulator